MSIFSSAKHAGRIFLFLGVVLLSFPLAEAVFRLVGDSPSQDLKGLYAPFADGNYKNSPSISTEATIAAGRIHVRTDSLGLRSDRAGRFDAGQGSQLDALIVGDSQGFGNGVNYEDTVAGSLAIAAAESGVRVANASVGGHSLASQLQLATWLVNEKKLQSESFVLLFTPAMIESSDRLNRAVVGNDGRLYGGVVDWRVRLRLWIKTNLVIYSRIRDAVRNLGIGANPAKTSHTVFNFYLRSPERDAVRERLLHTVTTFKDFAARSGASVQIVYLPLTVEADFPALQSAAAKDGLSLDPSVPFEICSRVAADLGLAVLDLRPVLRKVHAEGVPLNVKADFHYSAELSKACGVYLARHLNFSS